MLFSFLAPTGEPPAAPREAPPAPASAGWRSAPLQDAGSNVLRARKDALPCCPAPPERSAARIAPPVGDADCRKKQAPQTLRHAIRVRRRRGAESAGTPASAAPAPERS